ncbi:hypothetical protein E0500_030385 [Streptomyces sp. KM273126]|uniref:hypothetical protein n=1 Tax=Streptomyces sp. KM273126 TaxID=2545247 RepID=UPI00103BB84C|nr:hypothetical protein [Streptomyces sp. KM273126]MBA2811525.1 hypothetical protein [Streptomyces sp. KM273126]
MPKRASRPGIGIGVIVILLLATAGSAALACTATSADDAVARILFTIALAVLSACLAIVRHRDNREYRAHGDSD